eukprot:jgi/Psemu1/6302/gm1.6302_g
MDSDSVIYRCNSNNNNPTSHRDWLCWTGVVNASAVFSDNNHNATASQLQALPAPPTLLDQLLGLFEAQAVGTLGIFVADSLGQSCLRLVHGLRNPNKAKAIGYLDDIEGNAGELVQVNTGTLSKTPASRVLSLGHHIAELDAHHKLSHLISVVLEGAAYLEMISAHKAFFVPFELVPLLLGKGLSPRQATGSLYQHLNHHGLVVTCTPLFDTLRVAGTSPTPACNPTLTKPGPSFQSEPGLTMYTKNKAQQGPTQPQQAPIPPGDPLKLGEGLDQMHTHAVAAAWGLLYTKCLLLLCGKLEEADLPPIYPAWAQKSKHKKIHMIFQSQVASKAYELGIQTPLVTTAVLKRSAHILNVAAYSTMISTEGNSLTLKDSLELQKTKAYILVDWTEAITQLESYLAVLATILGATHAVVKGYQLRLLWLKLQQMTLRRAIADEMGELITSAIVIYYFQIRVRAWLEEQIPQPKGATMTTTTEINPPAAPAATTVAKISSLTPMGTSGSKTSLIPFLVTKMGSTKMRDGITSMRGKDKGPLKRPDGKERYHTWHIKGSSSFIGCRYDLYDHSEIMPSEQDQLWEWCQDAYA